jgi:hypothetical protein
MKTGDNGRLQSALRSWLQKTMFRLAEEPDEFIAATPAHPLLSAGNRQGASLQRSNIRG